MLLSHYADLNTTAYLFPSWLPWYLYSLTCPPPSGLHSPLCHFFFWLCFKFWCSSAWFPKVSSLLTQHSCPLWSQPWQSSLSNCRLMSPGSSTFEKTKKKNLFWPHCGACGILVSWPGIEPAPPALEAWSLNCWTTREVLESQICISILDVSLGPSDHSHPTPYQTYFSLSQWP